MYAASCCVLYNVHCCTPLLEYRLMEIYLTRPATTVHHWYRYGPSTVPTYCTGYTCIIMYNFKTNLPDWKNLYLDINYYRHFTRKMLPTYICKWIYTLMILTLQGFLLFTVWGFFPRDYCSGFYTKEFAALFIYGFMNVVKYCLPSTQKRRHFNIYKKTFINEPFIRFIKDLFVVTERISRWTVPLNWNC